MQPQNSSSNADGFAVVGRIGAAYGVKGWVHLQSFTEPPENILKYTLFLEQEGRWRRLEADLRPHKDAFVGKFSDVADREAARLLTGSLVAAQADEFDPSNADEVLWRDLIGLQVQNTEGFCFGEVTSMTETGHHDVLVIQSAEGHETLIPFADETVVELSLERGFLTVDWGADW